LNVGTLRHLGATRIGRLVLDEPAPDEPAEDEPAPDELAPDELAEDR